MTFGNRTTEFACTSATTALNELVHFLGDYHEI